MKKLKKLLLNNWFYYSSECIQFDDINFLTGKNGVGKSTIIDALQIVLLGELDSRNFNKAANGQSDRTIEGYLRTDLDSSKPRSRYGKDFSTHIVCEFYDDIEERSFVTGIIFDCHKDNSYRPQFFMYNGIIPENKFIVDGYAMDISEMRAYIKRPEFSNPNMPDSNYKYQKDLLAKWNVHGDKVRQMLKKAVCFKPINDIQKFITENICDTQKKPDINDMQQNIRNYKKNEAIAKRENEKLKQLILIKTSYNEMNRAREAQRLNSFLFNWGIREKLEKEFNNLEVKLKEAANDLEEMNQRANDIKDKKTRAEEELDILKDTRSKSDIYNERKMLEAEKKNLENTKKEVGKRLNHTSLDISREVNEICNICVKIESFNECSALTALKERTGYLFNEAQRFKNCKEDVFETGIKKFEKIYSEYSSFKDSIKNSNNILSNKVDSLIKEKNKTTEILKKLKSNTKDYPLGLIDLKTRLVHDYFSKSNKKIDIYILADVLEIFDGQEAWRGAIEGFLNTQKFYLLVAPEYYTDIVKIYDEIKGEYSEKSYGIVDVAKIKEHNAIQLQDNSLASKVKTENDLARVYIDYLLGQVVCCDTVADLRNHRRSITSEGMLYQSYVIRPIQKKLMNDVFIGQNAIKYRINTQEERLNELNNSLNEISPIYSGINKYNDRDSLFTERFKDEIIARNEDLITYRDTVKKLTENVDKLNSLNLTWLSELEKKIEDKDRSIKELESNLSSINKEIGRLGNSYEKLEEEQIPQKADELNNLEYYIENVFSEEYIKNIGLLVYNEKLTTIKNRNKLIDKYKAEYENAKIDFENKKNVLFGLRRDYVNSYQVGNLKIETLDNSEFDEEKTKLEESNLPKYEEKIKKAKESAMEQFQNDFLAILKSSIDNTKDAVKNLNKAIRNTTFGNDTYEFKVEPNPDYLEYYNMIMSPELMECEGGLFAIPFQNKYKECIENLFSHIVEGDDTSLNKNRKTEIEKNVELYTDFRTYLKFDLIVTDKYGKSQSLAKKLNSKSGGEIQTPFYIAILASFAQMYRVNDSTASGNTVRLILFDEAFSKMDSERIVESVRLLRKMHFQAIISAPTEKIQDVTPEADKTLLVCREDCVMKVLPYSKESEML